MLPINELFETVQGEATFTGTPSIFVRLQSCPVGCPWCDTKHTWTLKQENLVSFSTLEAKTKEDDRYARLSETDICKQCQTFIARHVVITGGEPCLYDLCLLTQLLEDAGFSTQIETSGTFPVRCDRRTWVTVSPKLDMPGGLEVLQQALDRANEIKMPIGKMADVVKYQNRIMPRLGSDVVTWFQPLSLNQSATAICLQAARMHHGKVSIQTHKYIGAR
jgi:7-carboxy-7-deazaguanine synthase